MNDRGDETANAARLAQRAVDLSRDDAEVLSEAGFVIAYVVGNLDSGAAFVDQALMLNPNWAGAWRWGGWVKIWLGHLEMALERFKYTIRLNPLDPLSFTTHAGIAAAHFYAGRYDEASFSAEKAGREKPSLTLGWRYLAASHALAGRIKEAQKAMDQLRKIDPLLRVSTLRDTIQNNIPHDYFARYEEGLRKAGLPE
jgi:tetratricopeptide (TPR) repeat protein